MDPQLRSSRTIRPRDRLGSSVQRRGAEVDVQEGYGDVRVVDADPRSASLGIHGERGQASAELMNARRDGGRPSAALVAIAHQPDAGLVRNDRDGAHRDRSGSSRRGRRVAEALVERFTSLEFQQQRDDRLVMDGVTHHERQLARECRPSGDGLAVSPNQRGDGDRFVERTIGPAFERGVEPHHFSNGHARIALDTGTPRSMVVGEHQSGGPLQ